MVKDTKDRDEKYELIKTCFDLGGKPYIKICCPCCDNLTEGSYQVITDIPKKLYCSQCCHNCQCYANFLFHKFILLFIYSSKITSYHSLQNSNSSPQLH